MSERDDASVLALEQAILERAQELAAERIAKAQQRRDNLLKEANDRLSLAEERELASAQAEAERLLRRQVQAGELRMQARLDRLRWELVQSVQGRLIARMQALREDRARYREWLREMIAEAAGLLPEGPLLAEVNADDHAWLQEEWQALVGSLEGDRRIELAPQPTWGSGGVRLRNADNTAQMDNRFEGRLARMEQSIQRLILQRLFPAEGNGWTDQGTSA